MNYEELRARANRYNAWVDTKRGKNGWASYKAEDVPPNCRISNGELSALEVYEFCRKKPDRYFAYVQEKERQVTTWTGEKLGDITWWGDPYKVGGFGGWSTRRNLRVKAINGLTYSGTYYQSSGDYCRVRKVKG